MISADVICDARALQPLEADWDDLAISSRAPYCSPVWMLAWWRNLADSRCALRVVVVRDGGKVVGVAPFYATRRQGIAHYRLLAAPISFPVAPLAQPGYEASVVRSVIDALASSHPTPDVVSLDGAPASTPWIRLLSNAWNGGVTPRVHRVRTLPAPAPVLDGRDYGRWLGSKSSNFRQQMRRSRKRLERKGATFRLADGRDQIERGLTAFVELHHARWRSRGGSNLARTGLDDMLRTVSSRFDDPLRFRLWLLEVERTIVSAQIFLGAGGELAYWNGGFDDGWAAERPALQTILAAIEHAFAVGDRRLSLGGGREDYKTRFADEEDELEWTSVLPVTPRYPLARLTLLPQDVRTIMSNHVSDGSKRKMKQLASRLRSPRGAGR